MNNCFIAKESSLVRDENFSDAIAVSDEIFKEFTQDRKGFRRTSGEDGMPAWEEIPPLTFEEIQQKNIDGTEQKKTQLIDEAREVISIWQTELQLGLISDSDKEMLIMWIEYIKKLNSIDTSTPLDIEWPAEPA